MRTEKPQNDNSGRSEIKAMTQERPKRTVQLYTDGACSGNPGPGGWGCVLCYKGKVKELSGHMSNTTNNRM